MPTNGSSRYPARLRRTWYGMRKRCTDPKSASYRWYGGKGVAICAAWESFEAFADWSLAHGYADDLVIDRIDAAGNYAPDNCQWITKTENARRIKRAPRTGIVESVYQPDVQRQLKALRLVLDIAKRRGLLTQTQQAKTA